MFTVSKFEIKKGQIVLEHPVYHFPLLKGGDDGNFKESGFKPI